MELAGKALILHARPHGENTLILTLFSDTAGKVKGLVRCGRKKRAEFQPGTLGQFTQRRRLEQQLGTLMWETTNTPTARLMENPAALAAVQYVLEALHTALPEEQAYGRLYEATCALLQDLGKTDIAGQVAWWELRLLTAMGYGLSLRRETAVPCTENSPLAYVSPNTGRAVSAVVGAPYKDRLLPLPHAFGGPKVAAEDELRNTFGLTGFFLGRAVHGKDLPSRGYLLTCLQRQMGVA